MKIIVQDIGNELERTGTSHHYGIVIYKGNPYDFSLCEMYEENSDSTSYELTIIDCEEEDEIEAYIDEFVGQLEYTKSVKKLGKNDLRETIQKQRDELIKLKQGIETGVWPHEEDETYLGETKEFVYFRDEAYNSPVMYRKEDNKKYSVEDIVSDELIKDVKEGSLIKISPEFIYD